MGRSRARSCALHPEAGPGNVAPMLQRIVCFWSLLFLALAGLGCGDELLNTTSSASFAVRGSVEQIQIWKAPPGTAIELRDEGGALVQSGTTDSQGSLVFR